MGANPSTRQPSLSPEKGSAGSNASSLVPGSDQVAGSQSFPHPDDLRCPPRLWILSWSDQPSGSPCPADGALTPRPSTWSEDPAPLALPASLPRPTWEASSSRPVQPPWRPLAATAHLGSASGPSCFSFGRSGELVGGGHSERGGTSRTAVRRTPI